MKISEIEWTDDISKAWIKTYTGKRVNVFDVNIDTIDIKDIAHSLSMCARFNGHLSRYYSVAEHSVIVSRLVPSQYALAGLLHDAAEAYIGDICRPIKHWLPNIKTIETNLLATIFKRYNVTTWTDDIWVIDRRLCLTEAIRFGMDVTDWEEGTKLYKPYVVELIGGWDWQTAEVKFMERFNELYD